MSYLRVLYKCFFSRIQNLSVYNIRSVILSRFDRVEGQLTVFEKVILEGRMVNMGVLLHKDISSSLLE